MRETSVIESPPSSSFVKMSSTKPEFYKSPETVEKTSSIVAEETAYEASTRLRIITHNRSHSMISLISFSFSSPSV